MTDRLKILLDAQTAQGVRGMNDSAMAAALHGVHRMVKAALLDPEPTAERSEQTDAQFEGPPADQDEQATAPVVRSDGAGLLQPHASADILAQLDPTGEAGAALGVDNVPAAPDQDTQPVRQSNTINITHFYSTPLTNRTLNDLRRTTE